MSIYDRFLSCMKRLAGGVVLSAFIVLSFGTVKTKAAPAVMPDGNLFDAEFYAAAYPDVYAAFGNDTGLLYMHYVLCGISEGRLPYDPAYNAAPVSDPAVPSSSVPTHYSAYVDDFDPVFYAAAYPDVYAVFGNDAALLYQHYLLCGKAEGRRPNAGGAVTGDGITEAMAYQRILVLKSAFPEGMSWTIDRGWYLFKGLGTVSVYGAECAGYAFMISDLVFGETPNARYVYTCDTSNVHAGDILRYSHRYGEHSVVVMEVNEKGVVCTEGNFNRSVHWGRLLTWNEIIGGFEYILTRYQ